MTGRNVVRAIRRDDLGAVSSPTRAYFRGRLEAIGLGRWASLYTGASKPEARGAGDTGWRR
jgi:hypothetical protein